MSTDIKKPPTEAFADLKAAIEHAFKGKPLAPEVSQRIHERAEAIRARLPETNIAVDLINEAREEI